MEIAFALDIIIAVLLVLTITYAVRLNRRLSQLRGDKKELQALAKTFAEATEKAESSIRKLKVSTEALQGEVDKAEALKDDLAYLVNRGGRTADQMVDSVRSSKPVPPQAQPSPARAAARYQENEDDGRLIQDAIRAATAGQGREHRQGQNRPMPTPSRAPQPPARSAPVNGFSDDDLAPPPAASSGQEAMGADADSTRKVQPFGGGLGGLRPEDRLLDGADGGDVPQSVGETDAARELLKALSSVK